MDRVAEHRTVQRSEVSPEVGDLVSPGVSDSSSSSRRDQLIRTVHTTVSTLMGLSVVRIVRRAVGPIWAAVTPLGRSVLAGSAISALLAIWFGWSEFAVLAVSGVLALAIGVIMLVLANNQLEVVLKLKVRRVVAGDFAATDVETRNKASRRMLPVNLEARVGRGIARVDVPSLSSGGSHEEQIIIGTERRAVVPVGPVRSIQGDPLGLVRKEVLWTGVEELFVHPRTTAIGRLSNGLRRDLEGETTNHRSPSDVAFHALREYVMGDDRRHVHWRTTARQADGTLMVREFVDTRRSEVAVIIGLRWDDWHNDDSFELGVSAVASVALQADRDGLDFVSIAGSKTLPARSTTSMMDHYARIERGSDPASLSEIVRRHHERLGATSVAVLVIGSTADLAEAKRAAAMIGYQALTVVFVADTSRVSGWRVVSGLKVCDLGALDDLRAVMATADS